MKRLKYGNKITAVDNVKFRSAGEAARYKELKLLQQCGKIQDLRCQVPFRLMGNNIDLRTKYVADFTYWEQGEYIIEDFKGVSTTLFRLKWAILKTMLPKSTGTTFRITGRNQ